jgi:hypothetical protein
MIAHELRESSRKKEASSDSVKNSAVFPPRFFQITFRDDSRNSRAKNSEQKISIG